MSLDGNWNQIISNKLVTRKREDLFLVQDILRTPSTDHRGIEKDCLLRKDICTDEYIHNNTKNKDSLLRYRTITPGEQTLQRHYCFISTDDQKDYQTATIHRISMLREYIMYVQYKLSSKENM